MCTCTCGCERKRAAMDSMPTKGNRYAVKFVQVLYPLYGLKLSNGILIKLTNCRTWETLQQSWAQYSTEIEPSCFLIDAIFFRFYESPEAIVDIRKNVFIFKLILYELGTSIYFWALLTCQCTYLVNIVEIPSKFIDKYSTKYIKNVYKQESIRATMDKQHKRKKIKTFVGNLLFRWDALGLARGK